MTISTLNILGGGGGGISLAPDLTFPSTLNLNIDGVVTVQGVNTVAGLTEMLGLTGKYAIEYLELSAMANESAQIKLTVDSEIIWNNTFTVTAGSLMLYGAQISASTGSTAGVPFICNTGLSLEVQMSADTSIDIIFSVRKVL